MLGSGCAGGGRALGRTRKWPLESTMPDACSVACQNRPRAWLRMLARLPARGGRTWVAAAVAASPPRPSSHTARARGASVEQRSWLQLGCERQLGGRLHELQSPAPALHTCTSPGCAVAAGMSQSKLKVLCLHGYTQNGEVSGVCKLRKTPRPCERCSHPRLMARIPVLHHGSNGGKSVCKWDVQE